jgi:hypothetical protein
MKAKLELTKSIKILAAKLILRTDKLDRIKMEVYGGSLIFVHEVPG